MLKARKIFYLRFSIALKECSETLYWLELLSAAEYIDIKNSKELIDDCSEINRILASIVKTTKEKLNLN